MRSKYALDTCPFSTVEGQGLFAFVHHPRRGKTLLQRCQEYRKLELLREDFGFGVFADSVIPRLLKLGT